MVGGEAFYRQFVVIEQRCGLCNMVDMEGEAKLCIGHFQLNFDDIPERGRSENVQYLLVPEQAEGTDQSDQPEIMIPMQVGYENMGDAAPPYLIIDQLDLGTLPAIDQVIGTVQGYHLAGGVTVKGRNSGIISQDSDGKHE